MKESNRQKKFGKLIQKEIGEMLQREISIPGGPMLTATVVRATPDLAIARIYISVFPDNKGPEALESLEEQKWEIRHQLARRIRHQVRQIPELEFFLDDTAQEVSRMDDLFKQIKGDDNEAQS